MADRTSFTPGFAIETIEVGGNLLHPFTLLLGVQGVQIHVGLKFRPTGKAVLAGDDQECIALTEYGLAGFQGIPALTW